MGVQHGEAHSSRGFSSQHPRLDLRLGSDPTTPPLGGWAPRMSRFRGFCWPMVNFRSLSGSGCGTPAKWLIFPWLKAMGVTP